MRLTFKKIKEKSINFLKIYEQWPIDNSRIYIIIQ